MLSALVLVSADVTAGNAPQITRSVMRTLSALVPLVVLDIVADAFVVVRPGVDLDVIAQTAGCAIIANASLRAGMAQASAAARRSHLLLLQAAFAPGPGFADEAAAMLGSDDGAFVLRQAPETFAQRIVPSIAPAVALIASRSALVDALTPRPTVPALARKLGAKPLRTLAVRV